MNSTEPANTGNYEQAFCKNTGSNEAWKANNIYDLAGNIAEWTQEAYENTYRASRGGNFFDNSATFPASNSVYTNPDLSGYNGFRYTSIFNNKTIKSID